MHSRVNMGLAEPAPPHKTDSGRNFERQSEGDRFGTSRRLPIRCRSMLRRDRAETLRGSLDSFGETVVARRDGLSAKVG
jgi:hypothetical protein